MVDTHYCYGAYLQRRRRAKRLYAHTIEHLYSVPGSPFLPETRGKEVAEEPGTSWVIMGANNFIQLFAPMLAPAADMALRDGTTRDWKREFILHIFNLRGLYFLRAPV